MSPAATETHTRRGRERQREEGERGRRGNRGSGLERHKYYNISRANILSQAQVRQIGKLR